MPSLGGSGSYGGDDPTGGYSGGFGGGGGSEHSDSINAALSSFFGEIDDADNPLSFNTGNMLAPDISAFNLGVLSVEEATEKLGAVLNQQAAKSFSKAAAVVAGILGGVATGSIGLGIALGALSGKVFSMESVQKAIASVQAGASPSTVTASLIDENGGRENVENNVKDGSGFGSWSGSGSGDGEADATNGGDDSGLSSAQLNPTSNAFWEDFVKEWQGTKEALQAQQDFKQEQLAPVFDTYEKRLAGLSNEATFKPINVSMGDFSTSFLPKRSAANAERILRGKLLETDIMDPQGANLSYLDKLYGIAQYQQNLKHKFQPYKDDPDDKGSDLDAASDIIGLASSAADLIDSIF